LHQERAASPVALLAPLLASEHLMEHRPLLGRSYWVLIDSAMQSLAALLVSAPVAWSAPATWQLLAQVFVAGTVVDVDRFPVAEPRSFRVTTTWRSDHQQTA
jgi:hypothetical protein